MSRGARGLGTDAELVDRLRPLLASPDDGNSDELGAPAAELEPAHWDTILARVMWSRLVEPGDQVAGALLAALGAETALQLLCEERSARRITEQAHASGASELSTRAVAAGLTRWQPRLSQAALRADLERGAAAGMRLLTPHDEAWPASLNDLGPHAPLVLWVRGNPTHFNAPRIAIVGARACTGYGTHITTELAAAAGSAGATVVSGAAYGVDAVAHRSALAAERPTIAVLAGGADRVYPSAHGQLLGRIQHTGIVCAELAPGTAPTRWRFLQRNRLIAALSRATLVTEAGLRSGSLNTAGHAATLGRALGAVPGPVTSAASAGCHRLIREYGATLVTNENDLWELLDMPRTASAELETIDERGGASRQPALHQRIIDALPLRGRRAAPDIAQRAGVGLRDARGVLAELELLGHVTRHETPDDGDPQWVLHRRE